MTARQALLSAYMFQAMFFFGVFTGLNSAEPGIEKVAVSAALAAVWPVTLAVAIAGCPAEEPK